MASSYFLSNHSPKAPLIRSSEPSPPPAANSNGTLSDSSFPGFQTPLPDPAASRSIVNRGFSSISEHTRISGNGSYGSAGGTGGKVRTSRRNKKTPYERPATGRHATPGGSAALVPATPSPSITSRLRDSASRFIASSASYLFPSLFKRRPLAIKSNGESHKAGAEEDRRRRNAIGIQVNGDERSGKGADSCGAEKETKELDIAQVEEVLKQRTWSREQVSRLTEVLQSRLTDNTSACPTVTGLPEQPRGEMLENTTPIQVARAYMEDQGARPLGIAALFQSPISAQSSAHHRTFEDRPTSSPLIGTHNTSTSRKLKRSYALDNDMPSAGPVRRVRQRTSVLPVSPYLYSKQITGATASTSTSKSLSRPPMKSSQTALRILQTLDKLSPSPKPKIAPEKSPGDNYLVKKVSSPNDGKTYFESRTAVVDSIDKKDLLEPSRAPEEILGKSPNIKDYKPAEENSTDKMSPSSASLETFQDSIVIPEPLGLHSETKFVKSKGFRMSAVFEESTSDEECKLEMKPVINPMETAASKPSLTTTSSPVGKVHTPELKNSPVSDHASISRSQSESMPVKSSPSNQSESIERPLSGSAPFSIFSFSSEAKAKETGSNLLKPSNVTAVSKTMSSPSIDATELGQPISSERVSVSSLTAISSSAISDTKVSVLSSSTSPQQTIPSQSTVGAVTEPVMLHNVNVSTSAPLTPIRKLGDRNDEIIETDNGTMMATESPITEKFSEVDTMATDFMTEETGASAAPSSSIFPPVASSSTFSLGMGSASSTAFPFTTTSQSSSSSASVSPFGSTFNSSGGQASMNGTSSNSLQVPHSTSGTSSLFLFGSSASSTTGHVSSSTASFSSLTSSASASFQFGTPSSSASSSNPFSASVSGSGFSSQPPSTGSAVTPTFPFGSGGSSASAGQPILFSTAPSSTSTNSSFPVSTAASNPFATSGASVSAHSFPFVSSVAPPSSSPFAFGSMTASATSSFPSTFGSMTTSGTSSFPSMTAAPSITSFGSSAPMTSSSQSTFSSSSSAPNIFSFSGNGSTSPAFGNALSGSSGPAFGSSGGSSSSNAFMFPNPVSDSISPSSYAFNSPQLAAPPAFGSAQQPIFGSSQPSSTPTFGSVQPTGTPTFGTAAAMPTFGSAQPASTPVFGSASPGVGPMFGLTQSTGATTFGSSQPSSAPFTFGGQNNVPSNSGQPYAFGAQPGMPAANPFSTPVAQPSTDFAGGFAVGASGGEKSGRKFIKAKRTGAAKRK